MRRSLDLQQLRTLHLLLTESSVSRTAEILGQSQPAVSASLRRLRTLLDDPLLVRSGARLVPTERGQQLLDIVARVLDEVDIILEPADRFDPATSERSVRIAAANCFGTLFIPRIIGLVRAAAPLMALEVCAMPAEDLLLADLESGAVDLVIGNWPSPPAALRTAPLIETDIVCMVRAGHPAAMCGRLSMADYLALDHVSPSSSRALATSPIDGRLAQLRLARRIAAAVPEYAIVPHVLARTDLVFTTGRLFADTLARAGGFVLLAAPPELGRMQFYLLWHERAHGSPCNRWLRDIVRTAAGDIRRAARAPVRREPEPLAISADL